MTRVKQLNFSVHYIQSQENTDFLLRKAHQQLICNTRTGKARSFSLEKSLFNLIDAGLQKQEKKLQLDIEIKLHPEISAITRYWNVQLVNENRL